eukprot:15741624-Heterocapsa_arctica.AAC.1
MGVIDNIPYLGRGSARAKPVPVEGFGPPHIPRRSKRASPAADLGSIPIEVILADVPFGVEVILENAPPVPPPP